MVSIFKNKIIQFSITDFFSTTDDNYLIAQLSNYIEEQARRRFNAKMQQNQNVALPDASQEFTYDFPINNIPIRENDPITFAVSPDDPRYYKLTPKETVKTESIEDEYGEIPNNANAIKTSLNDDAYLKLKAPMNVNPKLGDYPGSSLSRDVLSRHDLNGMIEKLQNRHNDFGVHKGVSHKSDVIQKPIEQHGAMGMYIVALVAGISAAVTVGLIGLGIAWFT